MPQNIYDTPTFFSGYSQLPRSVHGLDGAPEWPTLREMVGDVTNAQIIDLGCGFGWFCRWAAEAGASSVHGIDLSSNMLSRAREATTDSRITYECSDLETIVLEKSKYDVAYSSLVLHYFPDIKPFLAEVRKSLKANGRFVFSIEHPITTAPESAEWKWDGDGKVYWPLNQYMDEGERITEWLAPGVRKYHRTVETYLTSLIEAGFLITGLRESWSGMEVKKSSEKGEFHRPYFLLISTRVA